MTKKREQVLNVLAQDVVAVPMESQYVAALSEDKKQYRRKTERLQRELDKIREQMYETRVEYGVLQAKVQELRCSNFFWYAGTAVFAILGVLNTSAFKQSDFVYYYAAFGVACTFSCVHLILRFKDFFYRSSTPKKNI
jgi:hypothetical protein